MYFINNAKTGLSEVDHAIMSYLGWIGSCQALPDGNYAIAGGSFRCIFDKTRLRDLDVYILGSIPNHENIMSKTRDEFFGACPESHPVEFNNPFVHFKLINLKTEELKIHRDKYKKADQTGWDNIFIGSNLNVDIQLISVKYDSQFATRDLLNTKKEEYFVDTSMSSLQDVLSSFDLTISKAGVEFSISNETIAVSEVVINQEFLVDIAMRKLKLNIIHDNNMIIPQQLSTLKRFYKFIKLGYEPDDMFFVEWTNKLKNNPHLMEFHYD
jgi:hypothetical protein